MSAAHACCGTPEHAAVRPSRRFGGGVEHGRLRSGAPGVQVHGLDFYSGADGELTVEVYKSVKERLKRTSPDVEFRAMRTQKPLSGALVDERKRAPPPHAPCGQRPLTATSFLNLSFSLHRCSASHSQPAACGAASILSPVWWCLSRTDAMICALPPWPSCSGGNSSCYRHLRMWCACRAGGACFAWCGRRCPSL